MTMPKEPVPTSLNLIKSSDALVAFFWILHRVLFLSMHTLRVPVVMLEFMLLNLHEPVAEVAVLFVPPEAVVKGKPKT